MVSEFMPLIIYTLVILTITLFVLVIRAELRLQRFFRGTKVRNLEQVITLMAQEIESLREKERTSAARIEEINARTQKSIQGISTMRFNPFKGTSGSNQSFATAFLDGEGNGVVLSTLYSRERVSVFAKPVERGSSPYELTEEEAAVIKKAHNGSEKS
jgi:hypothetical protein